MKTVYKHWGKEVWLELNDFYCYKRIYINKGTRTSFQYHREKLETNYIISGVAEIWLENEKGVIEKNVMHAGDYFTVVPPRKHRVIALSDLILQEVSTPQVDDVVRIEDDNNRKDGKIENEHKTPALCILTAGKGSRLGTISSYVNKALIPINNQAAISYIIDKTPKEYDVIVAVGYKGDQVIDYCTHMHPDRNFQFVRVEDYNPKTTGPATSLYACKQHLQRPFIFAASDIIIEKDTFGLCDKNWLSTCETALPEIYATVNTDDTKVVDIMDKSSNGFSSAWTGLMSVYEYSEFWNCFDQNEKEIPNVIKKCLEIIDFEAKHFDWYDLGTYDSYMSAKKYFENDSKYTIPKSNFEIFYKRKEKVAKFYPEVKKVKKIIERESNIDKALLPNTNKKSRSMLCYDWTPGSDLYDIDNYETYKGGIDFLSKKLWNKPATITLDDQHHGKIIKFYKDSSLKRIDDFRKQHDYRSKLFSSFCINNETITEFEKQATKVFSYRALYDGIPVLDYHGDFHFANIIFDKTSGDYKCVDIRPDFENEDHWGDMYYDLGKMYAGCEVQFSKIKNFHEKDYNSFVKEEKLSNITLLEHKSEDLIKFKLFFDEWIKSKNLDLKKVKIIAGLVLCKIACLHEEWQGNFLFLNGRRVLNDAIKN